MPRIESSVLIHAPREQVLAVARDNEAFPTFMADLRSLTVLEKSEDGNRIVSEWIGLVPKFGTTIRWTEEDLWDLEAGTCTFRQIKGDYKQFEGVWTFTSEAGDATRFASVLDYEIEIPLVGPLIKAIVKKAVQDNLDSTLKAIKQRGEAATRSGP